MLASRASQVTEKARCSRWLWRTCCLEEGWLGIPQRTPEWLQGGIVSIRLSQLQIPFLLVLQELTHGLIHLAMPTLDQRMARLGRLFVLQLVG